MSYSSVNRLQMCAPFFESDLTVASTVEFIIQMIFYAIVNQKHVGIQVVTYRRRVGSLVSINNGTNWILNG